MLSWYNSSWNIGDLHISLPIVQGGMGVGVSLSNLSSAVANAGGIGVISAAKIGMRGDNPKHNIQADMDSLANEIRKAREMTNGVLGVNIMVALTGFAHLVKAAIEEKIDVIFAGAGLPLNLPKYVGEGCKTKLVPIVSSAKAVKMIYRWWKEKYQYVPDAFVVEGPLAGGHLGFKKDQIDDPAYQLEAIVSEVIKEVREIEEKEGRKIPVIAAGGIYSGEDIYNFLQLGATSVQLATRFVATHECDVDIKFKEAYINCKKEDIGIIDSPVGLPGRAIINNFTQMVKQGEKKPHGCPYYCITTCKQNESPYCIALALMSACKGNLTNGFAFIGAKGYLVDKIVSVKELVDSLGDEYDVAFNNKQLKVLV